MSKAVKFRYFKPGNLYCFSPPVMLATFLIEIVCALYVIIRYKFTPVTRLAVAVLGGLAVFQLAEYNVCEGAWGMDSLMWARIGYVAITLLPPLGLHLAMRIAGKVRRLPLAAAYGSAAVFSAIFLFVGHGMQGEQCLGNYVIFAIAPWAVNFYVVYYYGLLLATVAYCWYETKRAPRHKKALLALAFGYLAFILPTTAVNIIDPSTIAGIPSIMCGFAVLLALILTFVVLPYDDKQKGNDNARGRTGRTR